jgi:diguanylate cyclase (GGDEF)-like protein
LRSLRLYQLWRDQNLSRLTADLLSILGALIIALFAFVEFKAGHLEAGVTRLGFCLVLVLNSGVYIWLKSWRIYRTGLLLVFTAVLVFISLSDRETNTSLLWWYAYPLLAVPIMGCRNGLWLVVAANLFTLSFIHWPELYGDYASTSQTFQLRFSFSFAFVSFIAYALNLATERASTKNNESMELLQRYAVYDELTELYNRRGLKEKLQHELRLAFRRQTEMSIVLCDIDYFKAVNDKYGHDAGDEALRNIARTLKETARDTDIVGRWGGEEFLIVLPDTKLEKAFQLVERVRSRVDESLIDLDDASIHLSISCGLSSTRFCKTLDELVSAADECLYMAKADGRNCTRSILQSS